MISISDLQVSCDSKRQARDCLDRAHTRLEGCLQLVGALQVEGMSATPESALDCITDLQTITLLEIEAVARYMSGEGEEGERGNDTLR